MGFRRSRMLAFFSFWVGGCISAYAQLTITANFTTSNTAEFPGSLPMSSATNASTIEATINSAIAQITSDITCSSPISLTIDFVSDPNTGLGASEGTGEELLSYSTYLADLEANPNKSQVDKTALASLPAGPGTGINNNATQIAVGGALLDAIGDTTDGNSLISENGGFAGTVALNMTNMNISRTNFNSSEFDLVFAVNHEVDEILGIGGGGSVLAQGQSSIPSYIGPMDLYRFSSAGSRSFTTSSNAVSYFSIDGGKTDLVHFNQQPGADMADWGDGFTPADGNGNSPPQIQDAFGDNGSEPNEGPDEVIALDAIGWNPTATGLALEAVPEPGNYAFLLLSGLVLIGFRRSLVNSRRGDGVYSEVTASET